MKNLLFKQTTVETWQAMIQESAVKANILLTEELESYLVFLLMRFNETPALVSSVLAEEYLDAQQNFHGLRKESLREVGDKCLLFSGLYPGRASKKRVNVDYFIQLGRTAYYDLSFLTENTLSTLYHNLSEEFIPLMEVLLASWESDALERLLASDVQEVVQLIRCNKRWH